MKYQKRAVCKFPQAAAHLSTLL